MVHPEEPWWLLRKDRALGVPAAAGAEQAVGTHGQRVLKSLNRRLAVAPLGRPRFDIRRVTDSYMRSSLKRASLIDYGDLQVMTVGILDDALVTVIDGDG